MSERSRPLLPVAVDIDKDRNWFDGATDRQHINPTFTADDLARLRLGFNCLRCWEPQESAFPVFCWFCGYSMGELQTRDIDAEFEGEKHVGPSTTVEDELDILRASKEQERHVGGSSIAVSKLWTPPDAA